jgi:hypothetical protein
MENRKKGVIGLESRRRRRRVGYLDSVMRVEVQRLGYYALLSR